MATYYKYAERSAEDYVDWGAIGKTMSDTLLKEQQNRDKMKADIDKASNEFGEVLSNAPQGDHRGLNEYSQEFASNAQQYQLMQLRNLKAGKLSLKDYLIGRENLKQGANDAFDIIKKYNDKYSEYQQRLNDGVSSGYETFLLGEVEGFGNLTNTSLYINPTDGKVSAGKRVLRDPSKPYDPNTNPYTSKMSDNPNDFRSLVDLNFALSAQIDKYDSQGAIANIANSFAKDYQVITEKGARGAYTKVSDITQLGEDGVKFKEALEQKIRADFRTNPIHTISALKDYITQIPVDENGNFDKEGTLTTIDFTRNPEEANAHTILLKPNPSQPEGGTDVMDEDAEGAQELLDYMMEQVGNSVMASLNKKIEISAGRAPQQLSQASRAASSKRKSDRNSLNLLADLYYGTDEEIDTALENLRGLGTTHGPIKDIQRTPTGVTVITEGGTIPFSFKAGAGGVDAPLKTVTEFIEGISTEFGINFSDAVKGANIKKGKSFNNSTETFDAPIAVAVSPKDMVRKGLDDLLSQMLDEGKGSDKNLAREVGLQLKASGGKYSILQDGVELQSGIPANTTAVMQALKGVILNDEMLIENAIPALQKQGITIGEGANQAP
jgi:hypothetical protein